MLSSFLGYLLNPWFFFLVVIFFFTLYKYIYIEKFFIKKKLTKQKENLETLYNL